MTIRRVPRAVLALVGGAALSAILHAQPVQRTVYVSALDQNGVPVADLTASDIIVREDNATREVLSVARATEPMQIAVLVDNSTAASPFIIYYREALPAFMTALTAEPGSKNEIAVITLASRPTVLSDYTLNQAQITQAIQRIFAESESGSYLLDGIAETSTGIMKRGSTRPVIVAITGEGPELSYRDYGQTLKALQASGAALHVITMGKPENLTQDRSIVLAQGTRDSGGRYDTLLIGTALTGKLKELATELTHQYRVTYSRPQTLIPPDRVTVSTSRPGVTVRGTAGIVMRDTGGR